MALQLIILCLVNVMFFIALSRLSTFLKSYILHISTCINMNMFSFDNYRWKTFKIKMLHPLALPQHQPMPQLQTLTQHQLLHYPSWIIKVNNFKSLHQGKEMLMIKKSHKFGIILQNLMVIEVICGVINP